MKNRTKKITFLALLGALSLLLSYVELLIPPIYQAVPGIKVGLPNIAILFVLYRYGVGSAAAVSLVRLVLAMLLFGNPSMFIYSIVGASLSLLAMWALKKVNAFSSVGVSVAGGVIHNLGQILVAVFMLRTAEIGYYFPVLFVSGTLAGVFIGLAGGFLIKRVNRY